MTEDTYVGEALSRILAVHNIRQAFLVNKESEVAKRYAQSQAKPLKIAAIADPGAIGVMLLALLALILIPIALMVLLDEGLAASLNVLRIARAAFNVHYLGAWFIAAAFSVLATAITYPLQDWAITGILQLVMTLVISSFLGLLVTVWSFTIYGQVRDEIR
ncbi:hypothetical protein HY641_04720 [Candidatus Woesearchaeota archaeon]|nr:hypothetical protein [Candidatus Woesearchaeota archaeon]